MTPMISKKDAHQLYFQMLRLRMVEEEIASRYEEQEMRCPIHLSIGQEAAEVVPIAALKKEDYVLSGHRAHGHYLGKGGNLNAMIAELYGRATGCAGGVGGSMHLIDTDAGFLGAAPIVGSTIPIAVGTALASSQQQKKTITMVFFGDGATETGVFHEALNFAALKALPIIFVCENNLYSVYSPLDVRQPERRNNLDLVRAHGVDVMHADGNDPEQIYDVSTRAVKKARAGDGPVFIELSTYRWREHCGPNYDNDIGYRSESEFLAWKNEDPLANYAEKLIESGVATPQDLADAKATISTEIHAAFKFAKDSPLPPMSTYGDNVYA